MAYQTLNPATGVLHSSFEPATDSAVDAAVESASNAYREWRSAATAARAAVAARAAELFRERAEDLADIITREMGKPKTQALLEVALTADIFDYYATHGEQFMRNERLTVSSGAAYVRTEPVGVLLGVMPWNFPYYQVARFAAPNLVLGNTIIIKHAANCPESSAAIEDVLIDAGLPAGGYRNLYATHAQVGRIIADPRVQGVSVTGSEKAGAIIAEQAGRHLKKVVLELGGNDPFIVLDDHELDATIAHAVGGRLYNAGQACTSPKRFIVVESVYDRFVHGLQSALRALEPGDPELAETFVGPVVSADARDELLEQIEDAVDHGATLLAGGEPLPGPGAFLSPALLTNLTPEARAWSEELFGPVMTVHSVADADAAIALANDSPYGLGAAVFGNDPELNIYVAERLEAGMVFIGANTSSIPELPFGGVKLSGFGRELGPRGMDEFSNKKLIRTA